MGSLQRDSGGGKGGWEVDGGNEGHFEIRIRG